ncbi:MAG: ABC transporter ATP-binding protein [Synergistaceae bacterium]|jgi:sulfate transport system ATP-binding protein|nr:ABC transporter ATP-binding protein [Synergistaceae bacterium]
MTYLALRNIGKSFGNCKAADDVSFGVGKGKLAALLGPSGSGKTTLLRLISGLETPDSGDISLDGERIDDIPAGRRDIGFVFQNYALFRHMTVFDNIAFGLNVKKWRPRAVSERVHELISRVGLDNMGKRYPHQLSGGQRQRVAFARAIAPNPQVLLLDEPFAAIDARVRQELRTWLKETINAFRITSVFVTHDQDEAMELADEIVALNGGRVEQTGTPSEIYGVPATPFVARFIGGSSVINDLSAFSGFEAAEKFSAIIVRPECVSVEKSGKMPDFERVSERGIVERVSYRGAYKELKIRVHGEELVTNRPLNLNKNLNKGDLRAGDEVNVLIHRVHAFDGTRAFILENEKESEWRLAVSS